MNPWLPKATYLLSLAAMAVIRAPHIKRSMQRKVVSSRNDALDKALVAGVGVGLLLGPLLWVATPALAFADYGLRLEAFTAGVASLVLGLWLLHRSHVDLGTNWSNTLELREDQKLVTGGVYRSVRHPMYVALLLHALGMALVIPNGIAGPLFLVAFTLLFAGRVRSEEKMMLDQFGPDYAAYLQRTKRLIPGVY
jgi:protein-S-isoprenylcysteine O-methyltransferase Ste14